MPPPPPPRALLLHLGVLESSLSVQTVIMNMGVFAQSRPLPPISRRRPFAPTSLTLFQLHCEKQLGLHCSISTSPRGSALLSVE